jgi:glycosyltransferase involved in cell wall biosynthesis
MTETSPMHLVFDARHIAEPFTGLGRYSGELLSSLIANHNAHGLRLTVLLEQGWSPLDNPYWSIIQQAQREGRCEIARVDCKPISLKQHTVVGQWLGQHRPDLYFYPHFDAPLLSTVPTTFVVHDLIPLKVEGYIRHFAPIKRQYFKLMILLNLMKRRTCFTVSQTTMSDLQRLFPASLQSEMRVSLLGVPPPDAFRPPQATNAPTRYLLYVGDRRPHKNIRRTIDIFRALSDRWGYTGQLLLVGSTVNHDFNVDAHIGNDPRIRTLGNVPDDALNELYRQADALLLLSSYEGFGLPVVEASKWGRKVIVSDGGSLPEIAPTGSCMVPQSEDVDRAAGRVSAYLDSSAHPDGAAIMRTYSWERVARTIFPMAFRQPQNGQ